MAATVQQMQADDDAYVKQATDAQNAKQSQEALQGGEKPEPSFVSKFMTSVGRASTNTLDWAVSAADSINVMRDRAAHDIGAGVITAAVNTADAVGSAVSSSGKGLAAAEDPAHAEDAEKGSLPTSPIWDHAKSAILDFRDAVAVKDPTLSDNLLQGGAQLAVPFAGYSRAMAGLHGFANLVGAGALTDATALGPHDPRMADLIALGRHTEGKLGEVLRTLAPDGGAVNAYINYLTDRTNETEAGGRLKNILDGFGANMLVTPLLHAVASGLKHGTAGLRYAVENGVGSTSDLMQAPELPAAERDAPSGKTQAPQLPPEGQPSATRSSLESDGAVTSARTYLKAQTEAGHESSLHAMVTSLGQHLDASTEEGAFYKDILGRLSARNLSTTITAPGAGIHPKLTDVAGNTAGKYSNVEDTMALYPPAFTNNRTLVHTVAHEAVHAATVKAINETPAVRTALSGLMNEAIAAGPAGAKPAYGFKNPKEFVAEAESNPKFQKLLKETKAEDGRPVWDHYKEVIGGIFGIAGAALMAPQFDKLLTKEKTGA